MQGNRGGGNPFFNMGDPFAGFGGFGGFGGQRSLMSSFFGGRDPFDDPFFTQPFGGMQPSFFSGHPFPNMHPLPNMHPPGFLEQQAPEPNRSRGPIIEELDSDDEKEATDKGKSENPRKHGRPGNPFVEDPDNEVEERKRKQLHKMNVYNEPSNSLLQPQTGSFSFQSSTVTYGGANGAYYTSSTTRRMGSDGVTFEESKEADTAARKATHRVSRGIHNKGHSLTRKLSSDGNVETMQTLHNLDEDELPVFEATWKGKNLPGCMGSVDGANRIEQRRQGSQGGWALPPTENPQHSARAMQDGKNKAATSTRSQPSGKMTSDGKGRSGYYSQGRP